MLCRHRHQYQWRTMVGWCVHWRTPDVWYSVIVWHESYRNIKMTAVYSHYSLTSNTSWWVNKKRKETTKEAWYMLYFLCIALPKYSLSHKSFCVEDQPTAQREQLYILILLILDKKDCKNQYHTRLHKCLRKKIMLHQLFTFSLSYFQNSINSSVC